ncbi:DUF1642 domain-containing protein [Lactococcus lactis]|uniref:DUF1642 domain-containing protein n=1 Tax=Lactococcus lactis TaxID=1358 RepID=UPI002890A105|nr:DUF1642 domain-containing protein [Lactococcus lactis]MDT2875669.1 DUF1642 domain-containing protein [Lactococcus lactis]
MTKFEEEVKRPDNGPLTELNNNMQEVFSQYRKMRQYADYLEYDSKQKDEYILKLENENSFMRDERTTFDSNGMAVEPKLQQQALPVVPECVAGAIESIPDHYSAFEAISLINAKVNALPEENEDWLPVYNWLCEGVENQDVFALAFITRKYQVEKPKLFYLKAKELLVVGDYDHVEDLWLDWNKNFTPKKQDAHKFTQQEIDSMQTGSYEQIEVTE